MHQKQREKKLAQLLNTKILMTHIDRSAKTINKFRNSFADETKMIIHTDPFGEEYVYLKEFNKVREGLVASATLIANDLGISIDHNELWVKR